MTCMTLPVSPFVIRAAEAQAHADAVTIRADAATEAAQIIERTVGQRREAVEAGYAEGLRSGAEQAARLASECAATVDLFLDQRTTELHELAFAIAHRLLASLPPDATLAGLVAEAIGEHRRDVQLTLRVCDADAGPLRAALAEADPSGRVAVTSDPAASPGTCTLVHPKGRTRLGLVDQFRALMQAAP